MEPRTTHKQDRRTPVVCTPESSGPRPGFQAYFVAAAILLAIVAQAQDVLHLTDGTEAHGTILDWLPGEGVKLRTENGVVSVYPETMVTKVTRQPKAAPLQTTLPVAPQPLRRRKEPWVAFGLSFILPGAGQFYNGHFLKGLGYLGQWAAGAMMVSVAPEPPNPAWEMGAAFMIGSLLASAVDVPVSAIRINKKIETATAVVPAGVQLAVRF